MGDPNPLGDLGEEICWRGSGQHIPVDGDDMARLFVEQRHIHKFAHYIPVYETVFAPYRHRRVTMMEIGVAQGGSLQLWRNYFRPEAKIVGIDINKRCAQFNDPARNVFVRIGDQGDEGFLQSLVDEFGGFDLVLDDGSHLPTQTLTAFRWLFQHGLKDGGTYLVEDLSHCYWEAFQDGSAPFTEIVKRLVDVVHAPYQGTNRWEQFENLTELTVPLATTLIDHFTIYDGIVAVKRQPRSLPRCVLRP